MAKKSAGQSRKKAAVGAKKKRRPGRSPLAGTVCMPKSRKKR